MKFIAATALFTGLVAATPFGPPSFANYPGYQSYSFPSYGGVSTSAAAEGRASSTSAAAQGHASSTSAAHISTTTAASSSTTTASRTTTTTTPAYGTVTCLSSPAATNLVNQFASLLTAYNNATAEAVLATNFTDTSDSINFLGGYPLGATTFPSKAAFESGQGSQPAIGFNVLALDAIACNTVAFRWTANLGSANLVKGINVMYASNLNGTEQGWQIAKMFSEFNSAVWNIDIGGTCTLPGSSKRSIAQKPY